VSRRFVAATETALAELMSRDLSGLDLVAFMVDGVHLGEHTCVMALGIGADGVKHPLGVEEGSTENAAVVTDLITGLRDRGLDKSKPVLAVLDGAGFVFVEPFNVGEHDDFPFVVRSWCL
jgi:putative transposase